MSAGDPNIIVLAAGLASRMRKSVEGAASSPLAQEALRKTKSMIGIGAGSRPFMDYLLRNVVSAGYRNLIFVVGTTDDSIRSYYSDRESQRRFPDLTFQYAVQPIPEGRSKPLGTADALLRALGAFPDWKSGSFTVCNSDNLYSVDALGDVLRSPHRNCMIDYDREALGFASERIAQFAVLKKDAGGFLEEIVEKPAESEIEKLADRTGRVGVSMNLFRFSGTDIVPFLESVPVDPVRGEKELPAAVRMMVRSLPRSLMTIPRAERVIDLTSREDFESVQCHLREMYPGMD